MSDLMKVSEEDWVRQRMVRVESEPVELVPKRREAAEWRSASAEEPMLA